MKRKWFVLFNVVLIILAALMPPVILKAAPPGGSTSTDTYQPYAWQYNVHFDTVNGYEWQLPLISLMQSDLDNWAFFVFRQIDHNATDIKTATLSFYSPFNSQDNATHSVTIYGFRENDTDPLTLDPLPGPVTPPISRHVTANTAILNVTTWAEGWHNVTVTDIVKEILGLPGWTNLNNIGFKTLSVADVDRYIWSYSGNSTLSAKLYLEYYTGAKTYPGPWDNGSLFNTTEDGEMWEIWNSTQQSYGLVGTVNANQGRIYRLNFTDYADLPAGYTLWTSAQSMQTDGNKLLVSVGSTLYCLGYKVSTAYIYLMNSTDSGDSWNPGVVVGYGQQFGMAYDGNDKIFTCYRTNNVYTYWTIYTISTKTVSNVYMADPNLASTAYLSNPVYVPLGNKFMFMLNCWQNAYIFSFDMDTLTQDVMVGIATGAVGCLPIIHPNADSTQFYVMWWINNALYGMTVEDDCTTYSAVQTNIATSIYNYGNVWFDLDYDGSKWSCTYLSSIDKFLYLVERPAGSWGAPVLKSTLYTMVGLGMDYGSNILASNGYAIFVQSYATPTTKDVLSSAKGWGSVKQLTGIGSDMQGVDIVSMGGSGTHYYQFHWFNCTWEPYYPTPTYPTPPVEPEENIPDPVTGLVYFDRFHMRLYMLIFGLGCFLMPPLIWATGNDDLKMVLGGLISMVIGIGLLISITSI